MKKNTFFNAIIGILFLASFLFSSIQEAKGQCTGTLTSTTAAPTVIGTTITTACTYAGDAITITGLVAGNTYQFDNCNWGLFDSELTLWDAGQVTYLDYNDDFCGVQSGIVYTATASGNVEIAVTVLGCLADTICSQVDVTLVGGPITPPSNDMPCNADALLLNTTYTYSTGGGTVDANEASITPPLGNCLNGWCDFIGIDGSVWFTFVAPATGFVEVNACNAGTNFDTQLAVYTASNCNDYTTFSYIASNDDGTGCVGYASDLTVGCLTPGDTYYLLVDGYSGDTGTIELIINTLLAPPTSLATVGIAPDCPGGLGMAIAAGNGFAPISYLWSTNDTTTTISGLPGTYTVSITDGCGNTSASQTVVIPNTPTLVVDAGADQQLCSGNLATIGGNAASGGNPFDGSAGGYGYDAISGSFVKFPLADPTALTTIGAPLNLDLFAGDFTSSGFLGLDLTNQTLLHIDTTTGVSTTIGSCVPSGGQSWTGLAWNSANNTLYAASTDIAVSNLYTINPSTGAATLIGATGIAGAIWLAINNAGAAYSMDIVNDALYSVDLTTGAATLIGSIGFDANFIQDADFDPFTGVLYLAAYNNLTSTGELRTADLTTGITTYLGDMLLGGLSTEISAFGITNTGGTPYTYQWSPSTGLSDPTILNPTASPATTTIYTLTVTDACGTVASDVVVLTVNPSPILNLGPDISTCDPTPIVLDGGNLPGTMYMWCNGANTQTITVSTSGTYCLTLMNGGCSSNTDSVTVQFNASPIANAGANVALCSGNSIPLAAVATGGAPTYSYSWDNSVAGQTQTVAPTTTTTYVVTVTDNNGCTDTDDVVVTVNATPTTNAGADVAICAGESTNLSPAITGGTPAYTYAWSNNVSTAAQTVSPATTTTYVFTITDMNGCTATDNVVVTVNALPATPTFTINTGTGLLTSNAATGNQWYLAGTAIAGATGSTYPATQNGSYYVCVTNAAGCVACSTPQEVIILSIGNGAFIVPVTIFPNPVKDYLQITLDENAKAVDYTLRVYNALGQVVCEKEMTGASMEISTQTWASGIYTLQFLKAGNFAGSTKVVKE